MKIKTSATERLDRRYLLIRAESEERIKDAILNFSGASGFAEAAPIKVDRREKKDDGLMVIAINRKSLDMVRSAFEVSEKKIEIIRVSGTIKGLNL